MPIDPRTGLNTEGPANILSIAGSMNYFRDLFPHGPPTALDTAKGLEDIRASQARTESLKVETSLREHQQAMDESLLPLKMEAMGIANKSAEIARQRASNELTLANSSLDQTLRQIRETPAAESELNQILQVDDPVGQQKKLDQFQRDYPWTVFDKRFQAPLHAATVKPSVAAYLQQRDQDINDVQAIPGASMQWITGGPDHDKLVNYRKQRYQAMMENLYHQANGPDERPGEGQPEDFTDKFNKWVEDADQAGGAWQTNGYPGPVLAGRLERNAQFWTAKTAENTAHAVEGTWSIKPGQPPQFMDKPPVRGSGGEALASQRELTATLRNSEAGWRAAAQLYANADRNGNEEMKKQAQADMAMYRQQHDDVRQQFTKQGVLPAPAATPAPAPPPTQKYFDGSAAPTKPIPPAPVPSKTPMPMTNDLVDRHPNQTPVTSDLVDRNPGDNTPTAIDNWDLFED